ncbi:MAG: transcriptional regulator, LysR family [Clostridia bacterium]|jgi:DNA-binding transcriptional LysR family regulator|nr:transcriptional regulator, LysR family [Clostridia bacterium]
MELQQLKTFCTVAKTKSFTRTSEILDYAQSSISAQIRLLEEELQVKLFERMGRSVFLTTAGEKFLSYAENMLKLAEEAKEIVGGADTPKGTLTIGAPESICTYRLPEVLRQYQKRYPEVEIILKLGLCSELYTWVRHNIVDIAVLMENEIIDKDLVTETLKPESMVLVASANHSLVYKEHVKPEDLQGEQLILIEKDACYRCAFEAQLAAAGVKTKPTIEIGSIEAIKKFVISGIGISLLPQMAVEEEIASGVMSRLEWSDRNFGILTRMIYHKDKWLSPAIKAFIELSREIIRM